MSVEHHPLIKEFPDHRDKIHQLKESNAHFRKLMDRYGEIDKQVYRADQDIEPTTDQHAEQMKLERLKLKDEISAMLAG